MAKKSASAKKSNKSSNDSNVVRIKATPSAPKKRETATEVVVEKVEATNVKPARKPSTGIRGGGVPKAILNYFTGAWFELRQVRWPDRRATWSLTGAVLIYTAFFVVLVLLLDAFFKYVFELILGK